MGSFLCRSSREIEFVVPPTAAQYGSSRNINTLGVAGGGGARSQVGKGPFMKDVRTEVGRGLTQKQTYSSKGCCEDLYVV